VCNKFAGFSFNPNKHNLLKNMIQKTKGASLFWISIFWILGATFTLVKAQKVDAVAALLKNPDVVWVGEIEAFVPFDAYMLWEEEARVKDCINLEKMGAEEFHDYYHLSKYLPNPNTMQKIVQSGAFGGDFTMRLLKKTEITNPKGIFQKRHPNIMGRIIDSTFIAKNSFYGDILCAQRKSKKEVEKLTHTSDTVTQFDIETSAEILTVIANPFPTEEAKGYKVRQVVFYNQKKQAFGCISLALAPLIERYAENGNLVSSGAWAWVEVEPLAQKVQYQAEPILWTMQLQNSYDLSKAKVLKQQKKLTECIKEVTSLDFYQKQAAPANLAGFYHGNMGEPYSEKDLQEQIQIMKQAPSDFSPTTQMHFYQEWYFNGSTQKFSAHTTVFAPTYKEEWGTPAIYYKNVAQ
jgi:hypothetical protein